MVAVINEYGIISIHTLRMEGDLGARVLLSATEISIHTLRVEGDGYLA